MDFCYALDTEDQVTSLRFPWFLAEEIPDDPELQQILRGPPAATEGADRSQGSDAECDGGVARYQARHSLQDFYPLSPLCAAMCEAAVSVSGRVCAQVLSRRTALDEVPAEQSDRQSPSVPCVPHGW